MSKIMNLDSEKMDCEGMSKLKIFIRTLPLTDLLVVNKIIVDETNYRLDIISKKYFK